MVGAIGNFIRQGLEAQWAAFLGLLDLLIGFVLQVVSWLFQGIIWVIFTATGALVSLLPEAPTADHAGVQSGVNHLGWIDVYLPLTETISLLGIWATLGAALLAWKAIKALLPWSQS